MAPMKLQFKSATMLLILFVPNMHAQNFWQHTPFQGQGGSICIDRNDRIFVGDGNQEVYRSTDNGENWMQVNNGLTTNIWSMATGPNGDVFAGSDLRRIAPLDRWRRKLALG